MQHIQQGLRLVVILMITKISDDNIVDGNTWEWQRSKWLVSPFLQHDGEPDQVHGATQPLSAKLGKIKENPEVPLEDSADPHKIRRPNWRLKTKAPTKLGQITKPEASLQNEKNHML